MEVIKSPETPGFKSTIAGSIALPFLFVLLLWLVKLVEIFSGVPLADFGIIPRTFSGLTGILTSVFIHGGGIDVKLNGVKVFDHLLSNTFPLLILGSGLMFF